MFQMFIIINYHHERRYVVKKLAFVICSENFDPHHTQMIRGVRSGTVQCKY